MNPNDAYRTDLTGRAKRQLARLPKDMGIRIGKALKELAIDPRPPGVMKLKSAGQDCWRIRVGSYRILYSIDDEAQAVLVNKISLRDQAYRR